MTYYIVAIDSKQLVYIDPTLAYHTARRLKAAVTTVK